MKHCQPSDRLTAIFYPATSGISLTAVGSWAFVNKIKSELGLKAMQREIAFESELIADSTQNRKSNTQNRWSGDRFNGNFKG